ncbi:MAG TPA: VCBS repeat-containing protein [Armatimonadota bacterium]|nr:VCBS repeat-containing protein [Armatimonadota bacterium]HQK92209.1 VCBS repeat-containing protein [Armatimonadota bacterium]
MVGLVLAILALTGTAPRAPLLAFERQRIGTDNYEAASAFDVNNDGAIDIVSGAYWYEGPAYQVAHKIAEYQRVSDYYDDFSDYPMDVNGDGWTDIVTGGYFGQTLQWIENPKGAEGLWPLHKVAQVGPIERNLFHDIDGDGFVEVMPTTSPVHIFRLVRDAEGKGTGQFTDFVIAQPGGGGHGMGAGDVNADGRVDLVFSTGWFEAPEKPYEGQWNWHPELTLCSDASVPILVYDVNKDGLPDIIVGHGHDYGLDWWEQGKSAEGDRTWTQHVICSERSQYHDIQLVDIDKDGEPELLTGKRYRAHAEADPGSLDPVGVYYFEINGGQFERVTLDYGPAGQASGAGIYLWMEDVDGNGWPDVIAPGKDGLYLFRNLGPQP